jgi:hypothetical protein
LKDSFLIKEGYSKQDIEEMASEEYDFILEYIQEINKKVNSPGGI